MSKHPLFDELVRRILADDNKVLKASFVLAKLTGDFTLLARDAKKAYPDLF